MSLDYAELNSLGKSIEGLSNQELDKMVAELGEDAVISGTLGAAVASFAPEEPLSNPVSIIWRLDAQDGQKSVKLLLDAEGCHAETDPKSADADAILTTSMPIFLRLLSGKLSGVEAYAKGDLQLEGDMLLALRQPLFFGVDTSQTELSLSKPEDLSRLIAGRSDEEIQKAVELTGTKRVLARIFLSMEEQFLAEKAAGNSGTIEWRIKTPQGTHTYHVTIQAGKCSTQEGEAPSPTVKLVAPLNDAGPGKTTAMEGGTLSGMRNVTLTAQFAVIGPVV